MRKTVKVIAGWLHVTLILAILPPLFYAISVKQRSEASRTLYFRCLLIAFPVIAAGIAAEKCRGMFSYLLTGVLTFAATGALARAAAGNLYQSGEAVGYIVLLLGETIFVIAADMMGRIRRRRTEEVLVKEDPNREPPSDWMKEPSFFLLIFFLGVYAAALNVNSPEVCNAALFSAAVYGIAALLYVYVTKTERYLALNKRTCNLPSKRIYGIGSGMLAIFLLLLTVAALPSFLTASGRNYKDCREELAEWNTDYREIAPGFESLDGGSDGMPDWTEQFGEPKEAPAWVTWLLNGIGAGLLLIFAGVMLKMLKDMFRQFREAMDENGDIVEELEETDTEYIQEAEKRRNVFRRLSERESVRKQYRKFIRKHRKERPAVYESPTEIEVKAGVAWSEEGMALHEKYERVRYGE